MNAKATPPPELELAWLCGDYHLPGAGGLNDQDYIELTRMKSLRNIHRVVGKLRSLQGESVNTDLTINERLLLGQLQKDGYLRNIGVNSG